MDEYAKTSIKFLMDQDTTEGLAEALVVALMRIRDKDGKLMRIRLSEDYVEEYDYLMQIAKQLRGE
jgi:hypothetical protein